MDISVLVRLLRENGATHFEGYGVKIDFASPSVAGHALGAAAVAVYPPVAPAAAPSPEPRVAAQVPELPPDLRPDTMDVDKIMNWSAPPAANEPQAEALPLTGDAPITE